MKKFCMAMGLILMGIGGMEWWLCNDMAFIILSVIGMGLEIYGSI